MAGIPLPDDRTIDGVDMLPLLKGEAQESPHEALYFIKGKKIQGVRTKDNFKYLIKSRSENSAYWMIKHGPFLFNLNYDQMEAYNVASHFPEKEKKMRSLLDEKQKEMENNPRGWKSG
jgi:hypothetical protein